MDMLSQPIAVSYGLRRYLSAVYSYMAMALAVTGTTAFSASRSPAFLNATYVLQEHVITGARPLAWVVMLAPLALIFLISYRLARLSFQALRACYWAYAILVGLSLTTIFFTYSGTSIAQAFFVAAGMFGVMSLYGHTTQRNLTGLGHFLFMALLGLLIAMIAAIWLHHSGVQFLLSSLGVLIFAGLTAYDTQKLKYLYAEYATDGAFGGKLVVMGALTLYLDLLNLFLNLLSLVGRRRK